MGKVSRKKGKNTARKLQELAPRRLSRAAVQGVGDYGAKYGSLPP